MSTILEEVQCWVSTNELKQKMTYAVVEISKCLENLDKKARNGWLPPHLN